MLVDIFSRISLKLIDNIAIVWTKLSEKTNQRKGANANVVEERDADAREDPEQRKRGHDDLAQPNSWQWSSQNSSWFSFQVGMNEVIWPFMFWPHKRWTCFKDYCTQISQKIRIKVWILRCLHELLWAESDDASRENANWKRKQARRKFSRRVQIL